MQRDFSRSIDVLSEVFRFAEDFCSTERISGRLRKEVNLILEELWLNAVQHNARGNGPLRIDLERDDDAIQMTLTDFDAERFDPTLHEEPDVDAPLSERKIGGLGIHLVRQLSDGLRYEYRDRTSRTIVTKRLS